MSVQWLGLMRCELICFDPIQCDLDWGHLPPELAWRGSRGEALASRLSFQIRVRDSMNSHAMSLIVCHCQSIVHVSHTMPCHVSHWSLVSIKSIYPILIESLNPRQFTESKPKKFFQNRTGWTLKAVRNEVETLLVSNFIHSTFVLISVAVTSLVCQYWVDDGTMAEAQCRAGVPRRSSPLRQVIFERQSKQHFGNFYWESESECHVTIGLDFGWMSMWINPESNSDLLRW